jgi:hypothetical protein
MQGLRSHLAGEDMVDLFAGHGRQRVLGALGDRVQPVVARGIVEGTQYPLSTMPGEQVDHVFAGQMGPETLHFLESVLLDRPVMVSPDHARMVMESYCAADVSADTGEPVDLPLSNHTLAKLADLKERNRKS